MLAVAREAGARLSEETARKGGQRRAISAALRNDVSSVRTIIGIFTEHDRLEETL